MSASPRSRSQSPLELWAGRGKEETAAKGNWRERRSQSGEREAGALSPAEIEIRRRRPMFGCGREQRLEKMRRECGTTLPAERVLIDLHQRHKTGTNDFTTWLVQAVFPDGKDLPGYIVSDERHYKCK